MDNLCREYVRQFTDSFGFLKGKRVVLYGIGYRTGAVIESLGEDYEFVGLMDRDKENIGKSYFGVRVLSEKEVIDIADAIVIISVSFYDVIFKRIMHLSVDYGVEIYYPDGTLARAPEKPYTAFTEDEYKIDSEFVLNAVELYDVVSFDLFDTLVMRCICDPTDIFEIMDYSFRMDGKHTRLRKQALYNALNKGIPTIDEIYSEYNELTGDDISVTEKIKNAEIELEKKIIKPRTRMVDIFNKVKSLGKEVYIVSDMYLSCEVLHDICKKNGINIDRDHMIISSEVKASKENGKIWAELVKRCKNRSIIHIGDDQTSDVLSPSNYGIEAIRVYSAKEISRHTCFRDLTTRDLSLWNKICLGQVLYKCFNSPFPKDRIDEKGRMLLLNEEELGYINYGTIISSYVLFIIQNAYRCGLNQLCLCARDGYLLKSVFEKYIESIRDWKWLEGLQVVYLKISRLLAYRLNTDTLSGIENLRDIPYRGSLKDYFWLRYGIQCDDDCEIEIPRDVNIVEEYLRDQELKIIEKGTQEKRNYLAYLKNNQINANNMALVDFGYTGSTQYELSKALETPITGFYLLADMDKDNECNIGQKKHSYIFSPDDLKGKSHTAYRLFSVLESVYTAPYGTFVSCMKNGEDFEVAGETENQKAFFVKERINEGVLKFVSDIVALIGNDTQEIDCSDEIGQDILSLGFSEDVSISKEIKDSFFSDDVLRYVSDRRVFD